MGLSATEIWADIADAELDAGSPITQELMERLINRDKSIAEAPLGGRWTKVQTTPAAGAKTFARVYIPASASGLWIECTAGVNSTAAPISNLAMQVYITDGATYDVDGTHFSYSTVQPMYDASNNRLTFPQRVAFSVIDFTSNIAYFRGQIVNLRFKPSGDNVTTNVYSIESSPTAYSSTATGYGLRFG